MAKIKDSIAIQALKVQTRIGVYAWEQKIDQTLLFDISFPIEPITATLTFADAVDYDALCQAVIRHVEGQSFELIETVADQVAMLILKEFKTKSVTVRVTKPQAIATAAGVSVSLTRPVTSAG